MTELEFDRRWSNRSDRYPKSQPLPAGQPVHIYVDPKYGSTYSGQVAAVTAASLFGRMTKSVAFDVPSIPSVTALPWKNSALDDIVKRTLDACHQFGHYERRAARETDLRLVLGPDGDGLIIHSCGWSSYFGIEASPLSHSQGTNPFGAAFSVISAAAALQRSAQLATIRPMTVDTFLWETGTNSSRGPEILPDFAIGELWTVGVGSVGSCALFFLSLITRGFEAVLIDADAVKIENVTRSALFSWEDALAQSRKVAVAHDWLDAAGVKQIQTHAAWFHDISDIWNRRPPGTPDIMISAANERSVRSQIESAYPPVQVYATTGRNWQATLFRHIPILEACSCCVPGIQAPEIPFVCATGKRPPLDDGNGGDDIALPFLSYAAGLMTSAELAKLSISGKATTTNRVFFEPGGRGFLRIGLDKKLGCSCRQRDPSIHRAATAGSRFANLEQP